MKGKAEVGEKVVIIGAGNVGCDVATECARLGAKDILLIDIQKPAAFGKEREEAEHVGAKFRYPCFTQEVTEEGVVLKSGEVLPADTVIMSIGDTPDIDFLPDTIALDRGHIVVNEDYQTTEPGVYAIGDAVRPGLLTHAIGHGRETAETLDEIFTGKRPHAEPKDVIDYSRMTLEYFDPRLTHFQRCSGMCSGMFFLRFLPRLRSLRNRLPAGGDFP